MLVIDCTHLKQPQYLGECFHLEVVTNDLRLPDPVGFDVRVRTGGMLGLQLPSETDIALLLVVPIAGIKRRLTDLRWRRLSYKHVGMDLHEVLSAEVIGVHEMVRSASMASDGSKSTKWLQLAIAPPKSAKTKARGHAVRQRRSQATGSSGF